MYLYICAVGLQLTLSYRGVPVCHSDVAGCPVSYCLKNEPVGLRDVNPLDVFPFGASIREMRTGMAHLDELWTIFLRKCCWEADEGVMVVLDEAVTGV